MFFLRIDAEEQLKNALMAIKKKSEGVYVQASTLGSLEALLEFLKTQKIPVGFFFFFKIKKIS
jgi:translation initiation factor 5B